MKKNVKVVQQILKDELKREKLGTIKEIVIDFNDYKQQANCTYQKHYSELYDRSVFPLKQRDCVTQVNNEQQKELIVVRRFSAKNRGF